MNIRTLTYMLLMIAFIATNHSSAQILANYNEQPAPSAILVKLPTYSKRADMYEKAKNHKYAKQIKQDAANMQRELIEDFNTNFKYCDYYFFYDTVQDAIAQKQFAGNLYDKNLKLLTASPFKAEDTSYQIAYFGYYVSAFDNPDNPKKGKENTYYSGSQLQRLVLLNHQFGRIPDPAPNGTNYTDRYTFARFIYKWSVTYKSKLFDIYYTAYAHVLSLQMDNYYNRKNTQ